jgi:hypothetical protein
MAALGKCVYGNVSRVLIFRSSLYSLLSAEKPENQGKSNSYIRKKAATRPQNRTKTRSKYPSYPFYLK